MGWDDSPELPEGANVGDGGDGMTPAERAAATAAASGSTPRPRIPKAFWIGMAVFDVVVVAVVTLLVLRG